MRYSSTGTLVWEGRPQGGNQMDFYTLLDQVVDLLRQRQRVTYRALQRQFQLDDAALQDFKDELLYAHPEVRDDAGRGLVWTGAPSCPPACSASRDP